MIRPDDDVRFSEVSGATPRHAVLVRAAVVAAALLAAACSEAPASAGLDELPVWGLEEVVRIGHREDPDLGFSNVRVARRDAAGRIYVLEGQDRQVRVYEPDGRRVETVGRRGQGPGEFEFPSRMGLIGDTLWVSDVMTQRITLFSLVGELLRTVPAQRVTIEVGDPPITASAMASDPAGDGTFHASLAFPVGALDVDSLLAPRLRFDAQGQLLDTIGWSMQHLQRPVVVMRGGGFSIQSQPLNDAPISVSESEARSGSDDQLEIRRRAAESADGAAFQILRRRRDGSAEHLRTFPYRPVPIEPAEADSILQAMTDRFVQQGVSEEEARRTVRESVRLPRFHPPVTQARLSRDGALWLRREEAGGDVSRWTVLDRELEPVAELRLPRELRIEAIDGDYLLGVETDALEVPWVVGYRVVEG